MIRFENPRYSRKFIAPLVGAAIVGAAASALAAGASVHNNERNINFQKDENKIIRTREDQAVQRQVADMKAAGLNPLTGSVPQAQTSQTTAPSLDTSALQTGLISAGSNLSNLVMEYDTHLRDRALSLYNQDYTGTQDKIKELRDKKLEIINEQKSVISTLSEEQQNTQNVLTQNTQAVYDQILKMSAEGKFQYDFSRLRNAKIYWENGKVKLSGIAGKGNVDFDLKKLSALGTIEEIVDKVLQGESYNSDSDAYNQQESKEERKRKQDNAEVKKDKGLSIAAEVSGKKEETKSKKKGREDTAQLSDNTSFSSTSSSELDFNFGIRKLAQIVSAIQLTGKSNIQITGPDFETFQKYDSYLSAINASLSNATEHFKDLQDDPKYFLGLYKDDLQHASRPKRLHKKRSY